MNLNELNEISTASVYRLLYGNTNFNFKHLSFVTVLTVFLVNKYKQKLFFTI